jgi:NAD(P)-dependent dehydrogenase (short-subunit alcohol dehydrogenase family)
MSAEHSEPDEKRRCVLVTGAASGIGLATAERLAAQGARVLTVDRHQAEFCADLGEPVQREKLAQRIQAATPKLDAVIAAAGISQGDAAQVIAVNYFGSTALLTALRPLLARSAAPRALVISSIASRMPVDAALIEACLGGDEAAARERAMRSRALPYASSKAALARWVRRTAVHADWAGAGILLNAVAPGTVETAMTQPMLDLPRGRAMLEQITPVAIGRFGRAEEIAALLAFLSSADNSYMLGQVVFADGGCDALQRGDAQW